MSIIANNLLQGDEGYFISRSLRFRSSASAYLNRTPASLGSQKTWTWSGWIKLGLSTGNRTLIDAFSTGSSRTGLTIGTNGNIFFYAQDTAGNSIVNVSSNAVFRDHSAWYHICAAFDTTQATASNRTKLYINGVQQTLTYTISPALNTDYSINYTGGHFIGRVAPSAVEFFDGYLTEVNFIDGQALTPFSFGETDLVTGVWKAKKYGGTYGTNGFYLPFSDNTSTTTLGYDKSGNSNNWTTNNISLTAGSTYDSMVDVPTMSALGSNYCVMNPLRPSSYGAATLSDGNLKVSQSAGAYVSSTSTMPMSSGKWYWEVTCTSIGFVTSIGIASTISANGAGASGTWCYHYDGTKYVNGSNSAYGASYTSGDVLGFAYDAGAGSLTCYKNGTSQGVLASGLTIADYYAFATLYGTWNISYNFGSRPFSYTPPTGFVALNTFNLPEPSIKQGNKHFDAITFDTQSGSYPKTISGSNFQPDFVWAKSRSQAYPHYLFDSVRGTGIKALNTNATSDEGSDATTNLSSFNSNGFTVSAGDGIGYTNGVSWLWKAGGSAVSNTAGSITSQVSANPTAGFSVVTYTGNGTSGATIGHGLGVAPKMFIVKKRNVSGTSWNMYHASTGNTGAMFLDTTNSFATDSTRFNNTSPTSSVFSVGNGSALNNSGDTFVAYCFSEVAGYSKFGSYTGNGSADGTFVHLGFRPRYVMWKRTDAVSGNGWYVLDSVRNTYNVEGERLFPNLANAGSNDTQVDFLSNGFKLRTPDTDSNASGGTYIYMAFAETPTKFALAR